MKLPYLIDLIAVGVFAVSGCVAACRKSLDPVGVLVIAVVTAIGGGTLRDLLLSRHPIYWTADPNFLYVIAGSVLLTVTYIRFRPPPEQTLRIVDAIGLSLYSIVGAQFAEDLGRPAAVAVVMGTLTGTAGGVIRDMLVNDIPILFREGYLYATAAIAGSTTYVLTEDALGRIPAAIVGMIVVGVLRLSSIAWKWNLPRLRLDDWASP